MFAIQPASQTDRRTTTGMLHYSQTRVEERKHARHSSRTAAAGGHPTGCCDAHHKVCVCLPASLWPKLYSNRRGSQGGGMCLLLCVPSTWCLGCCRGPQRVPASMHGAALAHPCHRIILDSADAYSTRFIHVCAGFLLVSSCFSFVPIGGASQNGRRGWCRLEASTICLLACSLQVDSMYCTVE